MKLSFSSDRESLKFYPRIEDSPLVPTIKNHIPQIKQYNKSETYDLEWWQEDKHYEGSKSSHNFWNFIDSIWDFLPFKKEKSLNYVESKDCLYDDWTTYKLL